MKFKVKTLLLTMIASTLLGCNSSTDVGRDLSPNKQSSSHNQLKQATIGSIGMLGEPADVDGKAMQENSIPALNDTKVNVTIGPEETRTNSYISANSNTIASKIFANVKAGGGFGLFSASLGVEYAKEHQDNSGGVNLISEGYISYPVNISIKVPKDQYLTPEALEYLKTNGNEAFIEEYGSGYVSEIRIGTKFNIIYTFSSNDSATKQALKLAAEASYGSLASFSASIGSMDSEQRKNISKNIKIEIDGATGNIPDLPECDISNLEECTKNILNHSIKYINGTMGKYVELKDQLTNIGNGTPTLHQFFEVFNASGVADNSKFGMDLVKFAPYPKIDSEHDEEKEALQNYIIENISNSAMLSGDSSLMSILKNNEVISGSIASNPDIKELLDSENTITTYNNSLISSQIMKNILNSCFSGKAIKSCNDYLDRKDILKGTGGQKSTIRNYFESIVQKFSSNSVLKMSGYYSDVTPALANTFWLAAKDADSKDILIPIDLNNRTANRCKNRLDSDSIKNLSAYNGLNMLDKSATGSIFKDIKNGIISTEYYPSPNDLVLYPKYEKGKIVSVTRKSQTMNSVTHNGQQYNGIFTCDPYAQIWSPILGKNVSITKCNDTFGDFNGLNFYNESTTLLDAISMYRDKSIINRGYHIPSKEDICLDIGSRLLTKEQPWCSVDNKKCLSLSSNGSLTYSDDSQNQKTPYGAVIDSPLGITLLPNDYGFWYYSNKENKRVHTGIPGEQIGDAFVIEDGVKFYQTDPQKLEYKNMPADSELTLNDIGNESNLIIKDAKTSETIEASLKKDGKYHMDRSLDFDSQYFVLINKKHVATIYTRKAYIIATQHKKNAGWRMTLTDKFELNIRSIKDAAQQICGSDPYVSKRLPDRSWTVLVLGANATRANTTYYNNDDQIIAVATGSNLTGFEPIGKLQNPIGCSSSDCIFWTGQGGHTAYDWGAQNEWVVSDAQTGWLGATNSSWAEYSWKPAKEDHSLACVTIN